MIDTVEVSIGGLEEPAHVFGEVTDVAVLPDSRIVVVDRQARAAAVFDRAGELVRTLGREGEGPGEFLDPISLSVSETRVFVWDWRQRRITAFDLGSDSIETIAVPGQLNPTHHFGRMEDGRFVFGTVTGEIVDEEAGSQLWERNLGIIAFDPVGLQVDTIVEVPDQLVGWVDQDQRRTGSPHFAPRADFAASGGQLFWARGDLPLVVHAADARQDSIRWARPPVRVTPADVNAYREAWLARRPETLHAQINRLFEVMPAAEYFPTVGRVIPDHDGGVWVQVYAKPGDEVREVLRLDGGQVVCRVDLPIGFAPEEGGQGWLLGVTTDELGVERVERWTLHARGSELP
jgi:hypothetical protein